MRIISVAVVVVLMCALGAAPVAHAGTIAQVATLVTSDPAAPDGLIDADGPVIATPSGDQVDVFTERPTGWADAGPSAELVEPDGVPFLSGLAVSPTAVVTSDDFDAAQLYSEPPGGWSGQIAASETLTDSDNAVDPGIAAVGQPAVSGNLALVPMEARTASLGGPLQWIDVFPEPVGGWAGDLTESARLQDAAGWRLDSPQFEGSVIVAQASNDDTGKTRTDLFVEPAGGWSGIVTQSATLAVGESPSGSVPATDPVIVAGPDVFAEPVTGWHGTIRPVAQLRALHSAGLSETTLRDDVVLWVGCTYPLGTPDSGCGGADWLFEPVDGRWQGTITARVSAPNQSTFNGDSLPAPLLADADTIVSGGSAEIEVQKISGHFGHANAPAPPSVSITSLAGLRSGHPTIGMRVRTRGTTPDTGTLRVTLPAGLRFTAQANTSVISSTDEVTVRHQRLGVGFGPHRTTLITMQAGSIVESRSLRTKLLRRPPRRGTTVGTLQVQITNPYSTVSRQLPLRVGG